MESSEKLREAWIRAEERHAHAIRQKKDIESEVEKRWAAVVQAHRDYVRALEVEIASSPRPVRGGPEEDSGQWDEPGPDFERLVVEASSRESSSRVVAQRAIERMGPKAAEPLLAMLSRETARWQRRINVVCGVLCSLIVAAMFQIPALAGFPEGYWLMLLALPFLVAYAKPFGPHRRAAETLGHIDNIRVIGPLIEALDMQDPVIVRSATDALTRLLRRLHPGADTGLTETHWQRLFRAIDQQRHVELAIAATLALEQVGDERAIPLVAPLAEGKGAGAASRDVQQIARDCLEILADQSLRGRAGKALLRPAFGPAAANETLLQPASGTDQPSKEALLRATSVEQ